MPKRKSLIKRVEIDIAQRRRKCKFSSMAIPKGEPCVRVYDAPREYKGYCREVALKMIDDAREQLLELESQLRDE